MPKAPDLPCNRCGKMMHRGRGSLPVGQARCNACRRDERQPCGTRASFERTRICPTCSGVFTARRDDHRYCSLSCRSIATASRRYPPDYIPTTTSHGHRARARHYGTTYDNVDRIAVFERDNWFCQLCETPINPDLAWPAPMSASLDHVVPLSLGGDHDYQNTQAAHLRCNIAKGNRVFAAPG